MSAARALALVLLLAGCDAFGGAAVRATLDAAPAPAAVTLRLTNTGEADLETGPLPCSAALEVRMDGAWERSDYAPLILCAGVQLRLAPGATETADYPTEGLPPGTYRFRMTVHELGGGAARAVVSNEFPR